MPQFPSDAWMDEFCRRLEAQPEASDVAGSLDGVYRFVVEPGGPLAEVRAYDIEIRPDGDGAQVTRLAEPVPSPRLVMSARYDRWKQLVTGRLDVGMALMLRRLKVSGDLSGLMRDVGSTKPLMRALGEVDSDWLDG